ncbi:MAG: cytochrome b/b6 domain-containing protein [Nitrospinae bacterium]|nr:cytochrome b/b6 domain-containing protein [Nitrospinota bacterium]
MNIEKDSRKYVAVNVWDWQTRVLHWSNVILVITLLLLALSVDGMKLLGVEKPLRRPVKEIHAYIGYLFVFTLTLRIVWGFIGNRYARWLDIIPYKREQWQAIGDDIKYFLSGFKKRPHVNIGHSPIASLLYIALFIVLISQAVTGFALAGIEFGLFPGSLIFGGLGEGAKEALEDVFGEIHEFGLWFVLFFIFAHFSGLVTAEIGNKSGLLSSMIHGKKYFQEDKIMKI